MSYIQELDFICTSMNHKKFSILKIGALTEEISFLAMISYIINHKVTTAMLNSSIRYAQCTFLRSTITWRKIGKIGEKMDLLDEEKK